MAAAINFGAIPSGLRVRHNWVLRRDKIPVDRYGNSNGWNQKLFWIHFDEAIKELGANSKKFDGLGYIVTRDTLREENQVLGGDLDCCRDPLTGWTSPWSSSILDKLNTYVEVSPSGCGYRFFCYGKLPDGLNDVMGHGPDDLTEEARSHIIEAKPEIAKKLEKGEPAFNGLEIYEDGPKHLSITGQRLDQYPSELQHRRDEILDVIAPYLKQSTNAKAKGNNGDSKTQTGNKLPYLDILRVIDTSEFRLEGNELVGPDPIIGSTTGSNLKVNPSENVFCSFHNDIKKGGDA